MEVKLDKENLKVYLSRELNAPKELVWSAHSDRNSIPKWWGPRDTTTNVRGWILEKGVSGGL